MEGLVFPACEVRLEVEKARPKSNMQFKTHTLDNGLEIVAETNPQAYSAAYGFFVKTGARDETDEVSGVSHFLEHMVFKGTPTRSAADVNRELDELSSSSNAYTSEEQTVYYATTLPEDQSRIIALLADMMRPSLRQGDFDNRWTVVAENIGFHDIHLIQRYIPTATWRRRRP